MSDPTRRTSDLSPQQLDRLIRRLRDRRASGADGTAQPSAGPSAVAEGPTPRSPGVTPLPLSAGQTRIWFLDRLDPGSPAFNIPTALDLEGPVRVRALRAALTGAVERHEVLRTVYDQTAEGEPVQRVEEPGPVALPLVDLGGLPPAAQSSLLEILAARHGALPFDLRRGPVLRAALLRGGPARHRLLLSVHHVAADGASLEVLCGELGALYAARVEERPAGLPELPIQYADFALWQRERLAGSELEAERAFWREALAGDLPPLDLPSDRPRRDGTAYRGGRVGVVLDDAVTEGVRQLARRGRATLFMVLATALGVVLGRWSGRSEVILGTPIAGRERAALRPLIGCLLNVLALRVDLTGRPSWTTLLERVRRGALEAFDHRELPFERVLEDVRPDRSLGRTPLFQVLLNVQAAAAGTAEHAGLTLRPARLATIPSKFDLTLYAADREGAGLALDLVYNADLFDRERVEALLAQLVAVLRGAARDSDRDVGTLSLRGGTGSLPDPTRALGPARWTEPSLAERFARRAAETPEAVAIRAPGIVWSFAEVDRRAAEVAAALGGRGLGRSARIALLAWRSTTLPVALLGIHRAGCVAVLLDRALPDLRLAAQVAAAAPDALVDLAPERGLGEALTDSLATIPVADRWSLDPAGRLSAGIAATAPPAANAPEDAAYVLFTSGTTGVPKAVLGAHGPLAHYATWAGEVQGLGDADRVALLAGLGHDPIWRDTLVPLAAGASVEVPPADLLRDAAAARAWLGGREITVAHLTPALIRHLGAADGPPLTKLRLAISGGAALGPDDVATLRRLAPAARLLSVYGTTETPQAAAWEEIDPAGRPELPTPLGRGIDQFQLLVVGPGGVPAGVGELGEVWVRSPHLALGYLDGGAGGFGTDPFAGAGSEERIYRTGDLGRHLPDGRVAFAGRRDDQIQIRGYRVEPAEVEAALLAHPHLAEAAVLVRRRDDEAELVAFYRTAGGDVADGELRAFLAERLPAHALPARRIAVDTFPRTANGKLDREALLDRSWSGRSYSEAPFEPPRTPREAVIAGLWSELLERDDVGRHDDFFALGGHSLLATRLVARLRGEEGVDVPVRLLFEAPTLARFARRVDSLAVREGEDLAGPVAGAAREPYPLSFAQERLWLLHRLRPDSSAYTVPLALRLGGELELRRLAVALDRVRDRHRVLLTRYPAPDGVPAGVVDRAPLGKGGILVDLGGLETESRDAAAAALTDRSAGRPFDLAAGPVLRAACLRLGPAEHRLLVEVHHIATDAWSSGVLLRDLTACYRHGAAVRDALPRLPIQYADFALWQRRRAEGEDWAELLESRRRELAGAPQRIALPGSGDPGEPGTTAGRHVQRFDRELAAALDELARRRGCTLFAILLAALGETLRRWTGQEDLVLGTVSGSRDRVETEELVGCFTNFLPLRLALAGVEDGGALLDRARAATLRAHEAREIPFESLVESLGAERSAGGNPLYNVALLLQTVPRLPALSAGLTAELEPRPPGQALLDLRLVAGRGDDGLEVVWERDPAVLSGATTKALSAVFEGLLRRLAEASEEAESVDLPSADLLPEALRASALPAEPGQAEEPARIVVAATFTADPVVETVRYLVEDLELAWDVELAPYAQVYQQLLDPASALRRNRGGVNVLLIRAEDLLGEESGAAAAEVGEAAAAELVAALRAGLESGSPLVTVLCPARPVEDDPAAADSAGPGAAVAAFESALQAAFATTSGLHGVAASELLDLYPVERVHQAHGERLGHLPYTAELESALGTMVVRRAWTLLHPPSKVVAVDCDQTLWGGVCGEDGPLGVTVDPERRRLQEHLIGLQQAGMLLVLCSKNVEEDVWRVFETNPGMVLTRAHLTAWKINWRPKAENLAELARELDLGLDSFVFLDDNPVEIAQVEAALPEVVSVELSEPEEMVETLRHVWELDRLEVTAEDRRRTDLYRENAARRRFEDEAPSFEEFLAGLELEIEVAEIDSTNLARAAQLTQRTNQFNLGLERRGAGELEALLATPGAAGREGRIVQVRDRFGDYGWVGLMLFRALEDRLEVDTFLLSCRVLGRGVEARMLAELGRLAGERGLGEIELLWTRGPRNQPALEFLASVTPGDAFVGVPEGEGGGVRLSATAAQALASADRPATVGGRS